jgi:hypothetical protein
VTFARSLLIHILLYNCNIAGLWPMATEASLAAEGAETSPVKISKKVDAPVAT